MASIMTGVACFKLCCPQEAAEALAAMEAGLRDKLTAVTGELASKRAVLGELEQRRAAVAQALAEGAQGLVSIKEALLFAQESLELKQSLLTDKDTIISGLRVRLHG